MISMYTTYKPDGFGWSGYMISSQVYFYLHESVINITICVDLYIFPRTGGGVLCL